MSDLLKTKAVAWPAKPLGELFRINGDQVVPMASPSVEFVHYSIPAWDATGGPAIELGAQIESNKTAIARPSVLVSKLNPRKPRVAAVPTPMERTCCSTEFICYQPKQPNEDLNFWADYFASADFSARLARVAGGSTNSHTRAAPKETLKWFVPEVPSAQQQKIAQIFDTLDTAIHETEAIIAKLKAVKQGLLHDLLTRGIDANGELRPPQTEAPHLYKESSLGWIPKEWDCVHLFEKLEVLGGKRLPAGHSYAAHPTGFKYLRVTDFYERAYQVDELENLHERTFKALERYEIKPGHLYISIAGSLGHVGVHRVNGAEPVRTVLTENATRLVPISELNSDFVAAYMNSEMVQNQVTSEKGTGGGVPKLALFRIEQFWLAWPSDTEQNLIAKHVLSANERISDEMQLLRKLRLQKSGLMDDLLTGRVRVTPLLEGIAP